MDWPTITAEHRPWTRWWWLGSAVSEAEITRHLELFQVAGFGGVEVSPIYGVKGYEERWVPFLSLRWVDLFAHTLREAKRLGLGVDLITGTGWPFGGPWVSPDDVARMTWVEVFSAGEPVQSKRKPEAELGAQITDTQGKVFALFFAPTRQQVKRAAPGGEGNVLDHFDAGAVRHYLEQFDTAFARLPEGLMPRCFFNDSWEVYGANTTLDIFSEFYRRRGYDLKTHLPDLANSEARETGARVRADYRETMEDLAREAFLKTWATWAHRRGSQVRNQAHGSPGNLLDLYAAVDIPETEVFGPIRLKQAGLAPITANLPSDFGEAEELLICKMASSAAHVAGRFLCSSESFTWLGEHGHVPLEHMKAEVDTLLALGINHIFFHGTPFSPADVEWPGWLFYASTHVAPTNSLWRDLPALNTYIARCQSLLQAGVPDNEILFYFPYYDLQAQDIGTDLLNTLTVHHTKVWLRDSLPTFTETARTLWQRGWSYDLVSDRQLETMVKFHEDWLTAEGGSRYRTLLVSGCRIVPPETMEQWIALARAGATVLIHGDLPDTVPGLALRTEREKRLTEARSSLGAGVVEANGIYQYAVGKGRILTGPDVVALLTFAEVPRETLADSGIEFVRRHLPDTDERIYFIANPGKEDREGWFPLTVPAESILIQDAMTGATGSATLRKATNGKAEVFLQLPAGSSLLLRTSFNNGTASSWAYHTPAIDKSPIPLNGLWEVTFLEGGPTLPPTRQVETLIDWTTWGEAYQSFSGTARYTISFDIPAPSADGWQLHLGKVCYSARVRLNGTDLGTILARPWWITIPLALVKPTGNILEIEVTNLMANRLADLERRQGDKWRPFLLVNIHYKPFDAAQWSRVPYGLLGPVQLLPLQKTL